MDKTKMENKAFPPKKECTKTAAATKPPASKGSKKK